MTRFHDDEGSRRRENLLDLLSALKKLREEEAALIRKMDAALKTEPSPATAPRADHGSGAADGAPLPSWIDSAVEAALSRAFDSSVVSALSGDDPPEADSNPARRGSSRDPATPNPAAVRARG